MIRKVGALMTLAGMLGLLGVLLICILAGGRLDHSARSELWYGFFGSIVLVLIGSVLRGPERRPRDGEG